MNYSWHTGAQKDLRDAALFYRQRAGSSLSKSFLGEFEESIGRLSLHPELGSPWRGRGRRRYLMRRFPYAIIYSVSENEIRILAVAHHSRRPSYWENRR